jgi:hypothetical protein
MSLLGVGVVVPVVLAQGVLDVADVLVELGCVEQDGDRHGLPKGKIFHLVWRDRSEAGPG